MCESPAVIKRRIIEVWHELKRLRAERDGCWTVRAGYIRLKEQQLEYLRDKLMHTIAGRN